MISPMKLIEKNVNQSMSVTPKKEIAHQHLHAEDVKGVLPRDGFAAITVGQQRVDDDGASDGFHGNPLRAFSS